MPSFYLNDQASTIMIDSKAYSLPAKQDDNLVNFVFMVHKFETIKGATTQIGNDYKLTFTPFTNSQELDWLVNKKVYAYFARSYHRCNPQKRFVRNTSTIPHRHAHHKLSSNRAAGLACWSIPTNVDIGTRPIWMDGYKLTREDLQRGSIIFKDAAIVANSFTQKPNQGQDRSNFKIILTLGPTNFMNIIDSTPIK